MSEGCHQHKIIRVSLLIVLAPNHCDVILVRSHYQERCVPHHSYKAKRWPIPKLPLLSPV